MVSKSSNKVNLYVAGTYGGGVGACAWAVYDGWGAPLPHSEGVMCGPTRSGSRMLYRAIFEGLRCAPRDTVVTVYRGWIPEEKGCYDILNAIKQVKEEKGIAIQIETTLPLESDDLPHAPRELLHGTELMAERAWRETIENQSKKRL